MSFIRRAKWVAVLPVLAICGTAAAGPRRTFRAIDSEVQLFDDELLSMIEELRASQMFVWPRELGKKRLPISVVGEISLVQAEKVANHMLRPEWVPDGLRDKWIPFRKTRPGIPPRELDYLAYRYQVDDVKIQILEDGEGMCVVIDPGQHGRPAPSVEEYIMGMAPRFLALPPPPRPPKLYPPQTAVLKDGRTLVYGWCKDEDFPSWWPGTTFFSDGHVLAASSGHVEVRTAGKRRGSYCAGPYPRFRGSKPVQPKGPLDGPPAQPWQEKEADPAKVEAGGLRPEAREPGDSRNMIVALIAGLLGGTAVVAGAVWFLLHRSKRREE